MNSAKLTLLLILSSLILVNFGVYSPVLTGGFVWDDARYVTENSFVKDPQGLFKIWFEKQNQQVHFYPLTHSLFWLQHHLWDIWSGGFHGFNILLHSLNAVILFLLLRHLGLRWAFWIALLFSIHPLQVETVAWVSELKNILSLHFFLLSIFSYCYFLKNSHTRWYGLSLVLFGFSLLSKTSVVFLPFVLAAIMWIYTKSKLSIIVLRLLPFLILGASLAWITLASEMQAVAQQVHATQPMNVWQRLFLAYNALMFYLEKTLLPWPLMPIYPLWSLPPQVNFVNFSLFIFIILLIFFIILAKRGQKAPGLLFLIYIAGLFPVLGFVDHAMINVSQVADHYQYHASSALFILLEGIPWVLRQIGQKKFSLSKDILVGQDEKLTGILNEKINTQTAAWTVHFRTTTIVQIIPFSLFLLWAVLSWQHAHHFQSETSLWSSAYKNNPNSYVVVYNLGTATMSAGDYEKAIEYFQQALLLNENFSPIHLNLGKCLFEIGQFEAAIYAYTQVLVLKKESPDALANRGQSWQKLNRPQEALQDYNLALQINPQHQQSRYFRAQLYNASNENEKALSDLQQLLNNNAKDALALNLRGGIHERMENYQNALVDYTLALQINPDYLDALTNRAALQLVLGQLTAAEQDLVVLLNLRPDHAKGYFLKGNLRAKQQQFQEALDLYNQAITNDPNFKEALLNRASVKLKIGQSPTIICADLKKACDLGECKAWQNWQAKLNCPL